MSSISSKFFLIILFIILKSVTVWSSNLDKIKIIEEDIYLNNFEFFNYENKPVKVLDNKENYYILNFWASWCAPCIKEMKSLNALKQKFSKIKIITVSQDSDINDAKTFFSKNKYEYLEKYYDFEKKVSKHFSLRGLPTTFIFNKNYKVIAKVEGIIEWESKAFIDWLKEF